MPNKFKNIKRVGHVDYSPPSFDKTPIINTPPSTQCPLLSKYGMLKCPRCHVTYYKLSVCNCAYYSPSDFGDLSHPMFFL